MERVIPFPNIDPVLFDFGFFQIRWYALAYILGLVLGWQYVQLLIRTDRLWAEKDWFNFPREKMSTTIPLLGLKISHARRSFDKKIRRAFQVHAPAKPLQIDDLLLWAALGVIVGGRLGYILLYAMWYDGPRDYYLENPIRILYVWQGGMAFHGGFIGVVIAVILFAKFNKLNPLRLGDVIAPAAPIGLFFGRLANFINGELWGKVTTVPWGVIFPDPEAGPLPRHPSQLYEAGLEGIVLFTVFFFLTWHTRALHRPGLMTGIFFVAYSIARFSVEFVRETKDYVISPDYWFTAGMLFSIPMALVGAALIWYALRQPTPVSSKPAAQSKS